MKEKTWECPFCNYKITKVENDLTDYRRSLGLARHNHLKKHGLNTGILEEHRHYFGERKFLWGKQPLYKRDQRLVGAYSTLKEECKWQHLICKPMKTKLEPFYQFIGKTIETKHATNVVLISILLI
jgi:hypothetical protein